jgi:hypothetical protein
VPGVQMFKMASWQEIVVCHSAVYTDRFSDKYAIWVFYILLTIHDVMILGKWPTWCTNSFLCIYFIYNSVHVSSTSCSSSGERNCINTTSGNCHSVWEAVLCAGWEFTTNLYTTRPLTQIELPEVVLIQFVSPDDEHDVLETCREL